jgi:tetratricopeptide (TPR) repeat protein
MSIVPRIARSLLLGVGLVARLAHGQSVAELIANGDHESAARRPSQSLPLYERAIQADPRNYAALWKASRELVDLGEVERNDDTRSALYKKATDYAKRAIALNGNDPEGHFCLARAIGRTALSVGPRDRVKFGIEVRTEALRTLELAPKHPGALHVMGVWNAEIMRLGGFTRMVAKTFLGGKIFETASWAEAIRYMEASVNVEPQRMVHRLDMARVYRDAGRTADARTAFAAAIASPISDANDDMYRKEAEAELKALK